MTTPTIPISESGLRLLLELSQETGRQQVAVLDSALEEYRRKVFIDGVNADYASLRSDANAWAEFESEIRSMDPSLQDGLTDVEHWNDDGSCSNP